MRRALIYGVLILAAGLLQASPPVQQLFPGVNPDFLLVFITFLAINYGKTAGGITGFGAGFLQDLLSGGLFGINAVSKAITGYLAGILRKNIYRQKLLVPPLVSFFATVINQLLIVAFTNYVASRLALGTIFKDVIVPLGLFNAALAVIIYPILYKLGGHDK